MKKNDENIIEGFRAVEFMCQERDGISKEIQGMNFTEVQKYFEDRRVRLLSEPHKKWDDNRRLLQHEM